MLTCKIGLGAQRYQIDRVSSRGRPTELRSAIMNSNSADRAGGGASPADVLRLIRGGQARTRGDLQRSPGWPGQPWPNASTPSPNTAWW